MKKFRKRSTKLITTESTKDKLISKTKAVIIFKSQALTTDPKPKKVKTDNITSTIR